MPGSPYFVVAIDGPAGAGKSTVARQLAASLGVAFLDTGAIYRSVGLLAARRAVDFQDGEALAAIATGLPIRFETPPGGVGEGQHVFLGTKTSPTPFVPTRFRRRRQRFRPIRLCARPCWGFSGPLPRKHLWSQKVGTRRRWCFRMLWRSFSDGFRAGAGPAAVSANPISGPTENRGGNCSPGPPGRESGRGPDEARG